MRDSMSFWIRSTDRKNSSAYLKHDTFSLEDLFSTITTFRHVDEFLDPGSRQGVDYQQGCVYPEGALGLTKEP